MSSNIRNPTGERDNSVTIPLTQGSACVPCRERKVRCDTVKPICTPCASSRRECAYVPRKKIISPASTASLQFRLVELQDRYEELTSLNTKIPIQTIPPSPEISDADKHLLLEVFFDNQCFCCFYNNREGFFRSLQDPSEASRPHSSLVIAMLLLGIEFIKLSGDGVLNRAALQNRMPSCDSLVLRVQSGITDSLAHVDRLQDSFQAASLLSYWFFFQGRFQEAQYLCASTARLIIGAKLHQINGVYLRDISNERLALDNWTLWDDTLLKRPKDLREVGSRILTFWQSFLIEKIISTITGLPSAYDESEEARITSVWPRALEEYDTGAAFRDNDYDSISELFFATDTHGTREHGNRKRDTMFAMLVQAMAFIDRTGRLEAVLRSSPEISQSTNTQATLLWLKAGIDSLSARTPPDVTHGVPRQTVLGEFKEGSFYKANLLAYIWFKIYLSEIQICHSLEIHYALSNQSFPPPAQRSQHYHDLGVEAARKLVQVFRGVRKQTEVATGGEGPFPNGAMGFYSGFFLTAASVNLIAEIQRLEECLRKNELAELTRPTLTGRLKELRQDYLDGRQFIETLSRTFPILEFQLAKLDGLKAGLPV